MWTQQRSDFSDLDLIFKVAAVEKLRIHNAEGTSVYFTVAEKLKIHGGGVGDGVGGCSSVCFENTVTSFFSFFFFFFFYKKTSLDL